MEQLMRARVVGYDTERVCCQVKQPSVALHYYVLAIKVYLVNKIHV